MINQRNDLQGHGGCTRSIRQSDVTKSEKLRETEQLSLEFILPKIKKMRLVVLESIAKATKGLTGSEIVDDVNGYIVSVRPRLTELH